MKPVILLLSAICVALMSFLAYYSAPVAPMRAAGFLLFAAMLVAMLLYIYIPAWRLMGGAAMGLSCGVMALWVIVDFFMTGRLHFSHGIIGGAAIGAAAGLYGRRNRAAMRDAGIPYMPGDEHKSDEELASNADIKIWR